MQRLLRKAVRPVRGTGQTGRRGRTAKSDERSPGRDPIKCCGHEGRTIDTGLEELGFGDKSNKGNKKIKKSNVLMRF